MLVSLVQYLIFRVGWLEGLVDSAGSTNAAVDFLAILLGVLFTVFGLTILQSAIAIAMVDIDAGRQVRPLAAYRKVLPRVGTLLGAVLLAAVVAAILSLTAVGILLAVWLLVRWSLLAQVVALEDASWHAALGRSARLVRGNWWRVASLLLFITTIALLLGPLCGTLLLFVTNASFKLRQPRLECHLRGRAPFRRDRDHLPQLRPPRRQSSRGRLCGGERHPPGRGAPRRSEPTLGLSPVCP